jgi:hypothetical protein
MTIVNDRITEIKETVKYNLQICLIVPLIQK